MKESLYYLLMVLAAASCGQAPKLLPVQTNFQAPTPESTEFSSTSSPTIDPPSQSRSALPEASAIPGTSEIVIPQFHDPKANVAVQDYIDTFESIGKTPPLPKNIDPITNPMALTGFINQVGTIAQKMKTAEIAAKTSMSAQEWRRFKELKKQLSREEND